MFVTKVVLLYQIIIERFWKCFREGSWCYLELWIDIIQTIMLPFFITWPSMTFIAPQNMSIRLTNLESWRGLQSVYIWNLSPIKHYIFSSESCLSYILDLAKTVWAMWILSQKFTRNFVIKELWALENHVLVNVFLCSSHFTEVH